MYVLGKHELSGSAATKEGGVGPGGLQEHHSPGSTTGRSRGPRNPPAASFLLGMCCRYEALMLIQALLKLTPSMISTDTRTVFGLDKS